MKHFQTNFTLFLTFLKDHFPAQDGLVISDHFSLYGDLCGAVRQQSHPNSQVCSRPDVPGSCHKERRSGKSKGAEGERAGNEIHSQKKEPRPHKDIGDMLPSPPVARRWRPAVMLSRGRAGRRGGSAALSAAPGTTGCQGSPGPGGGEGR